MTLHTCPGCVVSVGAGGQSGSGFTDSNCNSNNGYNGCSVRSTVGTSYGTPFNAAGGGVYAIQWNSTVIKIWYFVRSQIPVDIIQQIPNPDNWGESQANFGGCAFDQYFNNMQLVSIPNDQGGVSRVFVVRYTNRRTGL